MRKLAASNLHQNMSPVFRGQGALIQRLAGASCSFGTHAFYVTQVGTTLSALSTLTPLTFEGDVLETAALLSNSNS